MPSHSNNSLGFSLVELLVVLAILGLLLALLLPAISAARDAARRTDCQNRLRQIGFGIAAYENARRGFPIGCIGCRFIPQRFLSWNIQVLPFLEERSLRFDLEVPSYKSPNRELGATPLTVFLCPSTPSDVLLNPTGLWKGMAFSDFGGIYGVEGTDRTNSDPSGPHWLKPECLGVMLYEEASRAIDIADGLSKTALVGESVLRRVTESEWANGNNLFAQEGNTGINQQSGLGNEIGSPHVCGASVVFCDGHFQFLAEKLDQATLNALLTRAGHESLSP